MVHIGVHLAGQQGHRDLEIVPFVRRLGAPRQQRRRPHSDTHACCWRGRWWPETATNLNNHTSVTARSVCYRRPALCRGISERSRSLQPAWPLPQPRGWQSRSSSESQDTAAQRRGQRSHNRGRTLTISAANIVLWETSRPTHGTTSLTRTRFCRSLSRRLQELATALFRT